MIVLMVAPGLLPTLFLPAAGLAPHLQTPAVEWALRPLALAFVPCRVRKHAADVFHQLEALGERTLAVF
jgi:hypothetical protein